MVDLPQDSHWERRLERERRARKAAESILEQKSLELYEANQKLKQARDDLEVRVAERTAELAAAIEDLHAEAKERLKVEAELRQARGQLMDAIESLDGGLAMYGPDERLVVCNSRFKEIYSLAADKLAPGVSKESFLQTFCDRGGHQNSGLSREDWIQKNLIEHRNSGSEGVQKIGERWIRANNRRMTDGGIVCLRTDITAFKAIQEAAETANLAKTQFLANMSHEFRTPIAAVVGYAEMLLDPQLGIDDRMRIVHSMTRNGRHLLALISDVLDLAKIEAGKLELEKAACRVWRIVSEALSVAGVIAHEKRLEMNAFPVGKIPKTITADPTRFRQILDNLLTNAVKFTEPGKKVELRVRMDRSANPAGAENQAWLVIEVEDQGIGMNQEVLGRIFRPFTQADITTTRKFGGTGLGLSICKRFAESMGGDIQARSQPGVGSCFSLILPVDPENLVDLVDQDDLEGTGESRKYGRGKFEGSVEGLILLAEDNPDNRNIIRFFLERGGLEVETAENGRVAVEKAWKKDYDLILMDMQMPELDGYAATSILRQKGYLRPILALTAHAMADDEEKCLQAGCSGYLTKPVDPDRLLTLISLHLKGPQNRQRIKPGPGSPVAPTKPVPESPLIPNAPEEEPTLEELFAGFRKSLPGKIMEMRKVLDSSNWIQLSSIAHQLRGAAGMYGLADVSFLAGLIEDACRNERETVGLLLGQLDSHVEKLIQN